MGLYEKYGKRILDIACATAAIVVFSPLYLGVAALVKLKLGSPVLFTQDRPGLIGKDGKETVFKMYKFRTMTDERDENGERILPTAYPNLGIRHCKNYLPLKIRMIHL